jgi:pilus assembly protein CpaF
MIEKQAFEQSLRSLLSPIAEFLEDATVSEILINGPFEIFVERRGCLERTDARFASSAAVVAALRNVAQYAGTYVDEQNPILEAQLPDGSRLEAVLSPIMLNGPAVAIRRFSRSAMTLDRLISLGAMDRVAADALRAMVVAKCNIVVAGGTGSGKTSLLNVLAACAPEAERMLVLEDTRELQIAREHVLYLEARRADAEGKGAISIRELFRASLRMRPDRIIVGEIRGAEAIDLLQAMVSGHGGCLATLHASTPTDTLARLETMCMMSDLTLPLLAVRTQVGSGVDVIAQVTRLPDGARRVTHITEVVRFDLEAGRYELRDLFVSHQHGRGHGATLVPTGILPTFTARLDEHGVALPSEMTRAARELGAPRGPH